MEFRARGRIPMKNVFSFDNMTEADVREEIVRPLLQQLGYQRGTDNNIRTEVTLRYARQFLGHKKSNDPDLVGRADYICEVISLARWVVEVGWLNLWAFRPAHLTGG
jgi:hypothetical protein